MVLEYYNRHLIHLCRPMRHRIMRALTLYPSLSFVRSFAIPFKILISLAISGRRAARRGALSVMYERLKFNCDLHLMRHNSIPIS